MKSDIEIAREVSLRKIKEVATGLGIPREEVQNYGRYIAKVPLHLIDEEKIKEHNLILVTGPHCLPKQVSVKQPYLSVWPWA